MNSDKQNTEHPMEKVQSHDWNKERLEQLKQLMPDIFTNDGKLNINELKKVIDPESINETERYEFRWFGKSNAKREAFTPTDATLVYDETRSVNPTKSENLIIEGENLAVLKLLSKSYRGQVKCIYIDPPYNTGKDFVYSDKFNQDKKEYWEDAEMTENGYKIDTNTETDGRFHSNWLNMMYSRLLIARQLLKEDGVIFISIDDNEVHHLRKLCDEVFGEENFVSELIVVKSKNGIGDKKGFSTNQDYVICYQKTSLTQFYGQALTQDQINSYNKNDKDGNYKMEGLFRKKGSASSREDRPNMFYPLYYNAKTGKVRTAPLDGFIEVYPKKEDGSDGRWVWKKETCEANIYRIHSGKKGTIYLKNYLEKGIRKKTKSLLDKPMYLNDRGTNEIKNIFKFKVFDTVKPVELLKTLFENCTNKNDIILDFFAGSGTTGQAVTELNQEDGSSRKYILVQLPEKTDKKSEAYKAGYKKISDITIERNKRVVEKIIKEKKEATPDLFSKKESEQEQLKGLGFKVFKLQKSNFPRVEYAPDPEKTDEENIDLLKKYIKDKEAQLVSAFNRDELITEVLIKNGFKLNYTLTKQEVFKENEILLVSDGDKETLICLDVIIADETVEHFKTNTDQKLIVLERALDTTKKWNLKHAMGDKFNAF